MCSRYYHIFLHHFHLARTQSILWNFISRDHVSSQVFRALMATYGKNKKKPFLPSFTVFHDDDGQPAGKSSYKRALDDK